MKWFIVFLVLLPSLSFAEEQCLTERINLQECSKANAGLIVERAQCQAILGTRGVNDATQEIERLKSLRASQESSKPPETPQGNPTTEQAPQPTPQPQAEQPPPAPPTPETPQQQGDQSPSSPMPVPPQGVENPASQQAPTQP